MKDVWGRVLGMRMWGGGVGGNIINYNVFWKSCQASNEITIQILSTLLSYWHYLQFGGNI